MIYFGYDGSGKKTKIRKDLSSIYGDEIYKLKQISNNIYSSDYHSEIDCRFEFINYVKEKSNSYNIINNSYNIIILFNSQFISVNNQMKLRKIMEKKVKIAFCTNNLSSIIQPLRSRCFIKKIKPPSIDELYKLMLNIAEENHWKLNKKIMNIIIKKSNKFGYVNIKLLKWYLMMSFKDNVYKKYDSEFDIKIELLYKSILSKNITKCRDILYKLYVSCFNYLDILKLLCYKFEGHEELFANYEVKIIKGNKWIIHIEALCLELMCR